MARVTRPTVTFRLLAGAAALATWALVAVGGVVRITESGLGCPDWPLCEGDVVPSGSAAAAIEFSHRATAALVTVLVVLVAAWAWRQHRSRLDILIPATVAAALIPAQAILGAIVVWLELPGWIVGFHFMVGTLFLATTVLVVVAAWGWRARAQRGFRGLSWAAAALGLLLVSAGAAVVSAHADEACGREWPECNGAFVAGGSEAAIQVVHRTLAYAVATLAVALAVLAWQRKGPRLAGSLPLLAVFSQMPFGVLAVLATEESTTHEVFAALHVAGAGVVWALLVGLAAGVGLPAHATGAGLRRTHRPRFQGIP